VITAALAGMQRIIGDPRKAFMVAADLADGRADGPEARETMAYARQLAM
jgi:hypothetical protein